MSSVNLQQAGQAASMASSGAKLGTMIMPGIGTVIGAVVGVIAAWVMGKPKPVRASAEQVAQCQSLLQEYMSIAAQSPNQIIPMELEQIKQLHWCLHAVYGAEVKLRDPRYFLAGFDTYLQTAKRIVRAVYETPIGQTVNLESITWKDPKGRSISSPAFNFTNTQFVSIKDLTQRTLQQFSIKSCEPWGGAACGPYWMRDVAARLEYDTLGYAARTELPNISEADLQAASNVATQIGTSAKDVVSAVESIIKRNVQQGETAQVLAPVQAAAPPPTPTVTVAVPSDAVPPTIAPPAIDASTLPPNATPADVQAALQQMTQQFMATQQAQQMSQAQAINAATAAAQQWLISQGIRAPSSAVEQVTKGAVTQAGISAHLPLLLGAGALVFALARPAPARVVYRRSKRR